MDITALECSGNINTAILRKHENGDIMLRIYESYLFRIQENGCHMLRNYESCLLNKQENGYSFYVSLDLEFCNFSPPGRCRSARQFIAFLSSRDLLPKRGFNNSFLKCRQLPEEVNQQ